jgi:hypothetical protein
MTDHIALIATIAVPVVATLIAGCAYKLTYSTIRKKDRVQLLKSLIWAVVALSLAVTGLAPTGPLNQLLAPDG